MDSLGHRMEKALNDDQANGLLERLQQLENCAQEGLDCPDAPPAR